MTLQKVKFALRDKWEVRVSVVQRRELEISDEIKQNEMCGKA